MHLVLGCTGSSLLHRAFSLVVVQWASHCSDFLCDSQAPGHVTDSKAYTCSVSMALTLKHTLSSCGSQILRHTHSVVVAHGLS